MDWKYSTVLNAAGVGCMIAGERLLENEETRIYGVILEAVGVGCMAAAAKLAEQGYKLKVRK